MQREIVLFSRESYVSWDEVVENIKDSRENKTIYWVLCIYSDFPLYNHIAKNKQTNKQRKQWATTA